MQIGNGLLYEVRPRRHTKRRAKRNKNFWFLCRYKRFSMKKHYRFWPSKRMHSSDGHGNHWTAYYGVIEPVSRFWKKQLQGMEIVELLVFDHFGQNPSIYTHVTVAEPGRFKEHYPMISTHVMDA